jgi:hypothetical protein
VYSKLCTFSVSILSFLLVVFVCQLPLKAMEVSSFPRIFVGEIISQVGTWTNHRNFVVTEDLELLQPFFVVEVFHYTVQTLLKVILDQTLFVDIENLSLLFSNSPPSVDNGY